MPLQSLLNSQIFAQNLYSDFGLTLSMILNFEFCPLVSQVNRLSFLLYNTLLSDLEKHTFKGAANLQISHYRVLFSFFLLAVQVMHSLVVNHGFEHSW